jgi:hypothetical protein
MEASALEAVNLAQATTGRKLDFTLDSIKSVEAILANYHAEKQKANPPAETVDQVCNTFGAYVGEVIRRSVGGEWVWDDKISPREKIPALRIGNIETSPSVKVFKRIMNGSEDDLWFYFRVLVEQVKKQS